MKRQIFVNRVAILPGVEFTPESENINFWPLSDFEEHDKEKALVIFPRRIFSLFNQEGLFLEEVNLVANNLPAIQVIGPGKVIFTKASLVEFLEKEGQEESGSNLVEFFKEGTHLITIGYSLDQG